MVSFIVKNSSVQKVMKRIIDENAASKYEIVFTDSWDNGIKESSGDYVCLTDKIFMISPKYTKTLLRSFTSHYRKLAMVSPAIGLESWEHKLYGYYLDSSEIIPLFQPSSLLPYFVQVGPIVGALIRKSSLKDIHFTEDEIIDSVNLSLHFWSTGQRCILNPNAVYYSFVWDNQAIPEYIDLPNNIEDIEELFAQELVK